MTSSSGGKCWAPWPISEHHAYPLPDAMGIVVLRQSDDIYRHADSCPPEVVLLYDMRAGTWTTLATLKTAP